MLVQLGVQTLLSPSNGIDIVTAGGTMKGVATSEGIGVVCAENVSSWETRLGWSEAKMWH